MIEKIEYRLTQLEGNVSTDLTKYLSMPLNFVENLNEELDTGSINLAGVPLWTSKAIRPKSKLRFQRISLETGDVLKEWDYIVQSHRTERVIGMEDFYNMQIQLIEPSAILQGMHVDNIALTYNLKDVSLNYEFVPKSDSIGGANTYNKVDKTPLPAMWEYPETPTNVGTYDLEFKANWAYVWENLQTILGLASIYDANTVNTISFDVPKLMCYYVERSGEWNNKVPLGRLSIEITVTEMLKESDGRVVSTKTLGTYLSGDTNYTRADDKHFINISNTTLATTKRIVSGKIQTGLYMETVADAPVTVVVTNSTEKITFNTPILSAEDKAANRVYEYNINVLPAIHRILPSGRNLPIERYSKIRYTVREDAGLNSCALIDEYTNYYNRGAVNFVASFLCYDTAQKLTGKFISSTVKYSAFDFMYKAILTCQTYYTSDAVGIDEQDTPFDFSDSSMNVLRNTTIYETTLQQKNLWEVMLIIGNYIHSVPKIKFAPNDKFAIIFIALGSLNREKIEGHKTTVFSSNSIANYYTQFDAYLNNVMSGEQTITELLAPKTGAQDYVITNDSAIIKTKYNILEIIKLKVYWKKSPTDSKWRDITSNVFENSIYSILTLDNPKKIVPAKGNSIFYNLGSDTIDGFGFAAPSVNNDNRSAFWYIMKKAYALSDTIISSIYINDCIFEIEYKTSDSLRYQSVRPDIYEFISNSLYETIPNHVQFFGQQDKIVDSQRQGLNLYGRLIRVGNDTYEISQFCKETLEEKQVGDLVSLYEEPHTIDRSPYYIVSIESELYKESTIQRIKLSKNYNQLSNIVTIPSEPRFYEIAKSNIINREISFIVLVNICAGGRTDNKKAHRLSTHKQATELVRALLLGGDILKYGPQYVWCKFRNDPKREYLNSDGIPIPPDEQFPSSELVRVDANNLTPESSKSYSECILPVLTYSMHNSVIFEWDMKDNFSAGEYIDKAVTTLPNANSAKMSMQDLRYVDIFGRADIMEFALLEGRGVDFGNADILPKVVSGALRNVIVMNTPPTVGVVLQKDNRESLSFNAQITIIANSDFIIGSKLTSFSLQKGRGIACFYANSITGVQQSIQPSNILYDNIRYSWDTSPTDYVALKFDYTGIDLINLPFESLVIYEESTYNILIAQNIDKEGPEFQDFWSIYTTG